MKQIQRAESPDGMNLYLLVNGKHIYSTNQLSDDYAFTNLRERIDRLCQGFERDGEPYELLPNYITYTGDLA